MIKYWRDFFYFLDYKLQKLAVVYNLTEPEDINYVYYTIGETMTITTNPDDEEEEQPLPEDFYDTDPNDFDPVQKIEGWAYFEYAMFYSHMGYILIVCICIGFFVHVFLRIQDSLGFYACLHFWIFELLSVYILSSFAFIYFIIFKTTLFQAGIFIYLWPRVYIYYYYTTDPYENYKEWERMNWYWLHRFMLILCCITTVILAPFIIYFCFHYLVLCNSFPILSS